MSSAKRKSLADDEAAAFVFGDASSKTTSTPKPQSTSAQPTASKSAPPKQTTTPRSQTKTKAKAKTKGKQGRAIDALMQSTDQERQVRITVDLAASQHQALTLFCAQSGKSKAEIIRALVDDFLNEVNQ
ncbi:MAG: plasmid partition protein ParG [Cyanobacteria bacterium P01_F01_bin.116]